MCVLERSGARSPAPTTIRDATNLGAGAWTLYASWRRASRVGSQPSMCMIGPHHRVSVTAPQPQAQQITQY